MIFFRHNRINKVHLYSGLLTGATVCFLYYGYKRKQLQKFSTLFRCGYSSYFALLFISGSFITFRYLMKFLAESSKSKAAIGSLVSLIMVLLGKTYFTHIELQRHWNVLFYSFQILKCNFFCRESNDSFEFELNLVRSFFCVSYILFSIIYKTYESCTEISEHSRTWKQADFFHSRTFPKKAPKFSYK